MPLVDVALIVADNVVLIVAGHASTASGGGGTGRAAISCWLLGHAGCSTAAAASDNPEATSWVTSILT